MHIPYTFHVHSILHLSFVLFCTFPGKVLVDTFAYRRASTRTSQRHFGDWGRAGRAAG